jgi:tetratricopeptide (TPR) repeat protein
LYASNTLHELEEAEFHFRQAIRLNPDMPWHYLELIETLLCLQRDYDKAVDAAELDALFQSYLERIPSELDRDIERRPSVPWFWLQAATLHLYQGDSTAYRRYCAGMLQLFDQTDDMQIAEQTAKTCLLAPGSVDDLKPVLELADRAAVGAKEQGKHSWFTTVRALASYRAGHFENALEWIEQSEPRSEVGRLTAVSIRAMTLNQLGRLEEARILLADAQNLHSQHTSANLANSDELFDWMRAEILYQEAAELIGNSESTAAPSTR